MPPRQSITLTEAELRLMKLLWSRGESSVADLTQSLAGDTPLAYTSVLTTIRVLEKKGYVRHKQEGRAFLYTAAIAEHEASRSEVRHLLGRFFGNSPRAPSARPAWRRRHHPRRARPHPGRHCRGTRGP